MTRQCEAVTVEHPDSLGHPFGFEVVCSIHGTIFSYNVTQIRAVGSKEIQRQINRAWVTHASNTSQQ